MFGNFVNIACRLYIGYLPIKGLIVFKFTSIDNMHNFSFFLLCKQG